MSRDLYVSLSGAVATWTQLEVTANNVSNSSTTAFKADRVPFQLAGPNAHPLGMVYAQAGDTVADFSDGSVLQDNDPYHLALQGPGFLMVSTGDGQVLTRDGRFHVNDQGLVVNADGMPLLGENGPIEVPPGEVLRIAEDGRVYGNESGELDRLKIVWPEGAKRVGNNNWEATGPLRQGEARVIQGALEGSNVDPMHSMIELTEIGRYFEAYQRAMQTSDELDARLSRLAGR